MRRPVVSEGSEIEAARARARLELDMAAQQAMEAVRLWLVADNTNMAERRAQLELARRKEHEARRRLAELERATAGVGKT